MANEIVIPFGTKALDAAKTKAKEILGLAKEAAKEIKDKLDRKTYMADARAAAKAVVADARTAANLRGQAFGALRDRAAGLSRSARAGLIPGLGAAIGGGKLSVGSAFARAHALASAIQGGSHSSPGLNKLDAALSVAAMSNNPYAQVAAQVGKLVLAEVDKKIKIYFQSAQRTLELRVDRAIKNADVRSRMERDPVFRRQQEEKARAIHMRMEKRQGAGWHPRSSRIFQAL